MKTKTTLSLILFFAITALWAQRPDCKDLELFLTSIRPEAGPLGTKIEIKGCNLADKEGNVNIWITHKATRISGLLYTTTEMKSGKHSYSIDLVSLMCNYRYKAEESPKGSIGPCISYLHIIPGEYEIHAQVGTKKSNTISFTVDSFQ